MPQPQSKAADLLSRVADYANTHARDELMHRRLRQEVSKLIQQVGAEPGAMAAKGILEAMDGNRDALGTYRQLVATYPGHPEIRDNHSTTLALFGRPIEAYKESNAAWTISEGNVAILRTLVRRAYDSGHIREAKGWLEQWRREKPDEQHPYADSIDAAMLVIDSGGFDEDALDALPAYVQAAAGVAAEESCPIRQMMPRLLEDEDSVWIAFGFRIDAPPARVAMANIRFASAVAENKLSERVGAFASLTFRAAA